MSDRKLISKSNFVGGMNRDNLSSLSDFQSFWFARNAVPATDESEGFGLTNEGSNRLYSSIPANSVGAAYCEERNWTFYFTPDDSIHYINHADGSDNFVMSASEFGCSWNFSDCEWIGGSVQFKTFGASCPELHIYFSSNCTYYRVNVDVMLDPDRKAGLITEFECEKCGYGENCEYFKVSRTGCAPIITPVAYNDGGGNVPAGSYIFLMRLLNTDGGNTNWFHHSDAVHVGSEHNIGGEEARGYIDINITGLDCKFSKAEIAVISRQGGIVAARVLDQVSFGNGSYTIRYTGNEGTPTDIGDLLTKDNTYIQGKYMIQKDGRMLFYGIKPRRNVNWQPKVNGIETEWVLREFAYSDVKKYNLQGFMGGESYSFGVVLNFADGMHSKVHPILATPVASTADSDQTSSSFDNIIEQPNDNVNATAQPQGELLAAKLTSDDEVVRTRTPKTDSVSDPQKDDLDTVIDDSVGNMDTDMDDLCEEIELREEFLNAACCNCDTEAGGPITPTFTPTYVPTYTPTMTLMAEFEDLIKATNNNDGTGCGGGSGSQKCQDEKADVEAVITEVGDVIAGTLNDDLDPTNTSTKIHEAAKKITEAVKNRERKERVERTYNIQKDVSYTTFTSEDEKPTNDVLFAGPLFNGEGKNITEVQFTEIASGATIPDAEENTTYPCMTDCNGEPQFGAKAGQPVENHRFPDSSEEAHFVSKAIGVPYGKYFGDSGEESDLYVRLLGVRFKNIQLPTADELDVPLCPNNPFTIVMIPRTDTNKQILVKGLATGTFIINNNGKTLEQPRYGVNSMEEVSAYHDDGSGGRLSNGGSGSSHTLFSLDGLTIKPSIAGSVVKEEMRLSGAGERYGLYAKGEAPEDTLRGSRIDAMGARQSINLSKWTQTGTEHDLTFRKYAKANDTVSPGSGGTRPLMNRSQQECIWIGSGMAQLEDESFTGDVLQHNAPIEDAEGQYVSVRRDLPNQYGNLENASYIPLIQAGPNHTDSIQAIVGDTYTGLFSFVKTGYVSDKVGSCAEADKFNIPAMVSTKMSKRCICDGPEDVVISDNGAWIWTELPEDGDAADPKNWAGTHTTISSQSDTYDQAVGTDARSDYYYPGVVTTNISYVGQFETCPWLREKSDRLEHQWYPEIKSPDFRFDSGVAVDANINGWKDSFLNQFHREIEQPALIKKVWKTIIRTSLNVLFPILGVDNFFDVFNGGAQFVGNLAEFPFLLAMWYLMLKVLFTNEAIDKLLGIPICKDDRAGGFSENYNRGLFYNSPRYNMDYSSRSDFYVYEGMPDPYYVCDCSDCQDGLTTNEIYVSDRQLLESDFDAYLNVRPLSKIKISASFGELTNLFVSGGQLYAHTSDVIIPIPTNRTQIQTDTASLVFGEAEFLTEPTGALSEGVVEGYAGLRRHNEAINTQYGYFFIDSEADIIYKFSANGLEPISAKGMFNFYKEKLNFCEPTECIDQRKAGTSFYAMGVDPRNNRFLITKREANSEYDFTMSYDLKRERWSGTHDYKPRAYIWDRRDMYTIPDEGGFWRHNEDREFQTFYGTYYPFEVIFTATSRDISTFNLQEIVLNTEAETYSEGGWIEDLDVTFNKFALWNSTQGTGTLEVVHVSDNQGANEDMQGAEFDLGNQIRFEKHNRMWQINEFKDYRKSDCMDKPLVLSSGCKPFEEINEAVFDCNVVNEQNYENKIISDKYARVKLSFDQDSKTRLNLIYVNTYGNPNE